MNKNIQKRAKRDRRHARSRVRMSGTLEKPRISVFRSNTHIVAQLIDDEKGRTLAMVSSVSLKNAGNKTEAAAQVGKLLGEKAVSLKIEHADFDRGGYKYHGRVKAVAEAAREAGLKF